MTGLLCTAKVHRKVREAPLLADLLSLGFLLQISANLAFLCVTTRSRGFQGVFIVRLTHKGHEQSGQVLLSSKNESSAAAQHGDYLCTVGIHQTLSATDLGFSLVWLTPDQGFSPVRSPAQALCRRQGSAVCGGGPLEDPKLTFRVQGSTLDPT